MSYSQLILFTRPEKIHRKEEMKVQQITIFTHCRCSFLSPLIWHPHYHVTYRDISTCVSLASELNLIYGLFSIDLKLVHESFASLPVNMIQLTDLHRKTFYSQTFDNILEQIRSSSLALSIYLSIFLFDALTTLPWTLKRFYSFISRTD